MGKQSEARGGLSSRFGLQHGGATETPPVYHKSEVVTMNANEYEAWRQVTLSSIANWVLDEIQLHNRGTYFFYKGGEDGNYIEVRKDGTATIGTYEGAIPHIGEAVFQVVHTNKVAETADAALAVIVQKMGLDFLLNLTGVKF